LNGNGVVLDDKRNRLLDRQRDAEGKKDQPEKGSEYVRLASEEGKAVKVRYRDELLTDFHYANLEKFETIPKAEVACKALACKHATGDTLETESDNVNDSDNTTAYPPAYKGRKNDVGGRAYITSCLDKDGQILIKSNYRV